MPPPDAPAIEFRHVSFSYPEGPPVLRDVSFKVERGERVALVGHTGAGKTTMVSLLCRFHETPHGHVMVGGQDVCSLPHRDLRKRIAIVQQDVFLFSDTIASNIRMGDETMDDDHVARMAATSRGWPRPCTPTASSGGCRTASRPCCRSAAATSPRASGS
ncbi:MAG: ATP-binding cassette domain-containing protein [Planctomycetota bacterium]